MFSVTNPNVYVIALLPGIVNVFISPVLDILYNDLMVTQPSPHAPASSPVNTILHFNERQICKIFSWIIID